VTPHATERVCSTTGLGLVAAAGQSGWRIAKESYVNAGGINSVLKNDVVGKLPAGTPDKRHRYATEGRTVYFAAGKTAAFAEVLQDFRVKLVKLAKDADAVGMSVEEYRRQVTEEAHAAGVPGPGEIPVDWQMNYGLYGVKMPTAGWWVKIDAGETLTRLTDAFGEDSMLTLADVAGENRPLTTVIAQLIWLVVLDDGSLPLGIDYPSKTGYGRCWAWFNRREDDGLSPGGNDPALVEELTVNVPELRDLCSGWGLRLVK